MPYIKQDRRDVLDDNAFGSLDHIENSGELNYFLTGVLIEYHKNQGGRYQQINDILGAIEGAKLEFYRRVAAPYEDIKIKENGDVY